MFTVLCLRGPFGSARRAAESALLEALKAAGASYALAPTVTDRPRCRNEVDASLLLTHVPKNVFTGRKVAREFASVGKLGPFRYAIPRQPLESAGDEVSVVVVSPVEDAAMRMLERRYRGRVTRVFIDAPCAKACERMVLARTPYARPFCHIALRDEAVASDVIVRRDESSAVLATRLAAILSR